MLQGFCSRRVFLQFGLLVGVVAGVLSPAAYAAKEKKPATLRGKTMGTYWQVSIAEQAITADKLSGIQIEIEKMLQEINQSMSTYIPDSELMQINTTESGKALEVSAPLRHVLAAGLKISEETDGFYDITVGPLVNIWGFGAKKTQTAPDKAAIDEALAKVGYQSVQLTEQGLTKTKDGVFIDLSSIAKGYAVDEIAAYLAAQGYQNYLVEIGGELRAEGNKFGRAWRIGVERPQAGKREVEHVIELKGDWRAMASSGNYRNFIDDKGVRSGHIINPKTGYSEQSNLLSVTVLAANCMMADGYATALMVLGEEKALAFAEARGLAVELILADNGGFKVVRNAEFERALQAKE